jgi:hypothetical protein
VRLFFTAAADSVSEPVGLSNRNINHSVRIDIRSLETTVQKLYTSRDIPSIRINFESLYFRTW